MHIAPRLYEQFQPSHYTVSFHLQESTTRRIGGSVHIIGQQLNEHDIRVHAKDLKVSSVLIDEVQQTYRIEDDVLIIDHVGTGQVEVLINYELTMNDNMHGIYPCYFEVDGVKKELIATQFESHHAREAFPCVDEPEAKATFDVTILSQPGLSVLSNMPLQSQSVENGVLSSHFEDTPRMSPYLLAFVVGEMQKKSAKTKAGVEVNVWATHAQTAESLDFGLDVAVRTIDFFNDYFKTPYPLPKSDHVALPDFSSGAMENWGLITYREICLLADDSTSVESRQYAATVIAHELSHQWFGNLVTMKWWDDLWLNESFATLMEYVAIDALFPDWEIWMTFATHEGLSALRRDYLPGIQAVKTEVTHPDQISTLFDPSIVYAKGARLLGMLRAYVGEHAFQSALQHYFATHAYGNTTGADLWDALSKETNEDIGLFMRPWLEQPGMPIVQVSTEDQKSTLSQHRFLIPADENQKDAQWPIPIRTGKTTYSLFDSPQITLSAPLPLNSGNAIHAVYAYDHTSLETIKNKLMDGQLPPIDRLSLLHELSLVARGGYQPTTDVIDLLEMYLLETNESVWDIISLIYADLKRFTEENLEAEAGLKARIVLHATSLYHTLGMHSRPDDSEATIKLRGTILGLLGYAEHPGVILDALELFRTTHDIKDLDGELRPFVSAIAVKHGEPTDVERVIALHHETHSADIRQDMCAALCSTKDPELVDRLLGFLQDESLVRPQDVDRWFVYLIRNRYAKNAAWEWMVTQWPWIEKKFKGDKSYDSFPRYAASAFSTYDWLKTYNTFFAPLLSVAALSRAITLGSKDIESRAMWIERDGASVVEVLTATKV